MRKKLFPILFSCFMFHVSCFTSAANAADNCADMRNAPSDKLDLQQVIELGLCRNPSTAAGYHSVQAARYNKNAAYAPYLPSIDVSAGITDQYRNKEWSGMNSNASVSANYLIFDFGKRLADLNNMAAIWRATGFDYDQSVQNFVYDIIGAYYGLLSSDAELNVANDVVKVAQVAKDTADKRFSAGAAAKADVLRAETNLAQRQVELQRATGNREIAQGRILNLLSFPQGDTISIKDMSSEIGSNLEQKSIKELIETAKDRRPDLLAAAENTNAAWHRRNAAFLRRLPSISASGSLSYNNTPNSSQLNIGNDPWSGQIGIRASMPIFAGFAHVYQQRAAQENYERAQELERARGDSTATDVWNAFQNYETARKVLLQTDTLLKSAMESERVVAGMYRVGRSTMLDWLTQQAELASAKRQNIAAKYDLYIKRAALALATGELREEIENEKK